jgi:ACT domain-containing protein
VFLFSVFQALTSSAVKKGGLSTGDVAALYMYKNTIFDVKIDTESNVCYFFICLKH